MKIKLTFLLLLTTALCFGQTFTQMGNTLQRSISGSDTTYRFVLGSPGYWYPYSRKQVDSKIATSLSNVVLKTGNEDIYGSKSFYDQMYVINNIDANAFFLRPQSKLPTSGNVGMYLNNTDGYLDIIGYNNGIRLIKSNAGAYGITAFHADPNGNITAAGSLTGASIVKSGGTSAQFLKADGSVDASTYEPAFSKNSAFNKNFGSISGTVAEGNDSRIINGQTAFGWGNHASAGYLTGINSSQISSALGYTPLSPTGSGASLTNVVNSITGTANQISTSGSTGNITLSLPQSIATSSTPTFGGETITGNAYLATTSGNVGIGTTTPFTGFGASNRLLDIRGNTIAGVFVSNLDASKRGYIYINSADALNIGTSSATGLNITTGDLARLSIHPSDGSVSVVSTPATASSNYDILVRDNSGGVDNGKIKKISSSSLGSTSGRYTPTISGITGLASSTAHTFRYFRTGDEVQVSGYVDLTNTTGGTTVASISLPIASTFTNDDDCSGVGSANDDFSTSIFVYSLAADTTAFVSFNNPNGNNASRYFISFMYTVR